MIDCEKCMYRKNGGCGYDKNGCGFVPKTGDLISREALKTIESIQSADLNSIETIREWIDNAPTVPAIPIPDNATNGDMIKAMFPTAEVKEKNNCYEVYFGIGTAIQFFNHQWWNAPYKRGDTE